MWIFDPRYQLNIILTLLLIAALSILYLGHKDRQTQTQSAQAVQKDCKDKKEN